MARKKPVGWPNEPGRHAAAAKGVKTGAKTRPLTEKSRFLLEGLDELGTPSTVYRLTKRGLHPDERAGWQMGAHADANLRRLEKGGLVKLSAQKSPRGGRQWGLTAKGRKAMEGP